MDELDFVDGMDQKGLNVFKELHYRSPHAVEFEQFSERSLVNQGDGIELIYGGSHALAFDLRQPAGLNAEGHLPPPCRYFPAKLKNLGKGKSPSHA
jgi:hypothetical protein